MLDAAQVQAIREQAEALSGQKLGEQGDLLAQMAAQRAMAYCQRPDIPKEMEQAVAALLLVMAEGGSAKTIQRGDTSITYDTARDAVKAPESLLAPFCRLGRVE